MAQLVTDGPEKGYKDAFLEALSLGASVCQACKDVGVPRRTIYRWRKEDQEFAKAWADAVDLGTDSLEDEAVRRAYRGVKRPVYQGGKLVGHVREYSDTLLMFLLKGRRPEKFKDRVQNDHRATLDVGFDRELAERILNDPVASACACDLLERVAASSCNAGGAGLDGKQSDVDTGEAPQPAQ